MNLVLRRGRTVGAATIGELKADGEFLCWALEDAIRERPGEPVAMWKLPGITAIPEGTYPLTVTMSPRFGVPLPLVVDVPGFAGVRIHAGNRPEDTEGCILVGLDRGSGWIGRSREALGIVLKRIQGAIAVHEPITLTIVNPPEQHLAGDPSPAAA